MQDGILKSPQPVTFLTALLLVEMNVLTTTARTFDGSGKTKTHECVPPSDDECHKTPQKWTNGI
jgi:hypothetical protein